MSERKIIALALTTGWLSEADIWEATGYRNGWGRTSDLVNKLGMTIGVRWVLKPNGSKSHMIKHVTRKEFKRVFGSKK